MRLADAARPHHALDHPPIELADALLLLAFLGGGAERLGRFAR